MLSKELNGKFQITGVLTFLLCLASFGFSAERLIEAESFDHDYNINGLDYTGNVILYGDGSYNKADRHDTGWVLDQQFMDQMGSPYLLAHGLGYPVSDATKTVDFPSAGTYKVWVRTFDWVGRWKSEQPTSPKYPDGYAPGRFEVLVNGVARHPVTVGNAPEASAFGADGTDWYWQDGGTVSISNNNNVEIKLNDLTGYEGRCDAIFFTTDMEFTPPNDDPEMDTWRRGLLGTEIPIEQGHYDLVVVGGGVAGMSASLQAARLGLTVALIQDRPVPGGNNSSEIRVHLLGSTNHEPYPRVGDITREVVQLADRHYGPTNTADIYADDQNIALLAAESNISLFFTSRVNEVEMNGDVISAVIAENVQTAQRLRFTADWFVDSTGDAAVGYLAGADYEIQLYDGANISSVHMGRCNNWNVIDTGSSKPFPACPWAFDLTGVPILYETNPNSLGGWEYESGFKRHPINDSERIRDGNFRAMYGVWDSLKNDRGLYPNYELNWSAYVSGKRESRRLLGDHILTFDDIMNGVVYPDGCFGITRSVDLHYPRVNFLTGFDGDEFVATATFENYTGPYWIPYRCLYSRNVDNLFMAGRNASFTHHALGAPRVMKTGGMMGEIVGMAASICKEYNTSPRGVYTNHLSELLNRLGKIYLTRWLEHIGPNYALFATASASSEYNSTYVASNVNDGSSNMTDNSTRWLSAAGVPNWVELTFSESRYISASSITSGWWNGSSTTDPIDDFVLQYYDGSDWVGIDETQTINNSQTDFDVAFPSVESDRFRLYITRTKENVSRVFEVELFHPTADLNDDGSVDMADFAVLSGLWLENDNLLPKDLYYSDGKVDLQDFSVFSEFWSWPSP